MKLFRVLGVISCAVLAFANDFSTDESTDDFSTDTHFDQSPLMPAITDTESKTIVNGKLRYKSNSHICETTPGVGQKSGYITVGKNMSMWFWFFEARTAPEKAPLTLWLNGGPGASSMMGLFQENGPCYVNPDNVTTVINKYSWNNVSNMIYIDQPMNTGFSYGSAVVNSTDTAAIYVWEAFQVLFSSDEFKRFKDRELIFATESYGGHYGPGFETYFRQQNKLIDQKKLKGIKLNFDGLLINNGWIDPLIEFKAFTQFVAYAPRYGPLQPRDTVSGMAEAYYKPGGCKDLLQKCAALGTSPNAASFCYNTGVFCRSNIENKAYTGYYDFDLRQPDSPLTCPRTYLQNYLNLDWVRKSIGAEVPFLLLSDPVKYKFNHTGDDMRTRVPQLQAIVDSGLPTLIWAGDADITCNWFAGRETVHSLDWHGKRGFNAAPYKELTVNGAAVGVVKSYDNLNWAVIYDAGHEIPAYQPIVAFEVFKQFIQTKKVQNVTATYPTPGPGYCLV